MTKKNWKIFYPLLLGIYSAVGLVSVNISQMIFLTGIRTILVTILFSIACYAIFSWRIRNEYKAALMCAWFFLLFFSYGHVYDALEGWNAFGIILGRHRFLFPLWTVILGIGMWLIYKRAKQLKPVTRILNIVSIILLVIPIFQIATFEWKRNHPAIEAVSSGTSIQMSSTIRTDLPDVYYIILDGYARDDILLENYNLDISGFISELEEIGFYVPPCSQSNYGLTALSLSSALNMDYIEQILPNAISQQYNWVNFGEPLRHSRVRQMFEEMGYTIVSFENGIWWSEWTDADYYITSESHPYDVLINFREISDFEILYLRTTALRVVEEAGNRWLFPILKAVKTPEEQHAERVLLALDTLGNVPQIPEPKFVFLHLISPHDPYVFSPDGEFIYTEAVDPGYPNQIQYLNKRLAPLMQRIIEQSSVPPIIIFQADHGWGTEVRMANFMALYFPGGGDSVLYPNLTPINIFRLVFNTYFGQKFPLLEDTSYYSPYDDYYEFVEVTHPCDPER